jgi:hypothetical protein
MRWLACLCCLLLFRPATAAPAAPEKESPAEKLRKALDQTKDFEVSNQPLAKFAETISEQTGIRFVVDPAMHPTVPGLNTLQLPGLPILSLRGSKLRIGPAVSAILAPHGLRHVILGDRVLLTSSARATHLAMRQRVSVSAENVVLEAALRKLSSDKAVNIVLDPQVGKEKNSQLNLRLTDVSLEAAVQVLAASAGLEAVRLGNVLFVTMPAKAKALRPAAEDLRTPLPAAPTPQVGLGGGLLGAMGGVGGGGMIGLAGGFGIGGGGALGNFGNFGNLGLGGGAAGAFGLGGGGLVGMAGGAGIMGIPPQKPKPENKPEKKTDSPSGKTVKLGRAGLYITALNLLPPAERLGTVVKAAPQYSLPAQLRQTQQVLVEPQEFKEVDDPSLTLGQMLDQLSAKLSRPREKPPFFLQFNVNGRALKAAGLELDKFLNTPVAEKRIPKLVNWSGTSYLRLLLDRCPVSTEFILRKDGIEITTRQAILAEFYHDRPKTDPESLPPLVNVAFDRQPLDEALEKLSSATEGFNVVLNVCVKEAKMPVSATFRNVPLDTAVWTLADMAGLVVVRKDNVLYVTQKKPARKKKTP